MSIDNTDVKDYIQQEVIRDKKAEKLIAKLHGVKSIEEAKSKGAKVIEGGVKQITLASPVFLTELQGQEPALSGAVAATEKGKFSSHPVKGYNGVYVFKVDDKHATEGKFDAKQYEGEAVQRYMQALGRSAFQELFINADVTDNRYLFF